MERPPFDPTSFFSVLPSELRQHIAEEVQNRDAADFIAKTEAEAQEAIHQHELALHRLQLVSSRIHHTNEDDLYTLRPLLDQEVFLAEKAAEKRDKRGRLESTLAAAKRQRVIAQPPTRRSERIQNYLLNVPEEEESD